MHTRISLYPYFYFCSLIVNHISLSLPSARKSEQAQSDLSHLLLFFLFAVENHASDPVRFLDEDQLGEKLPTKNLSLAQG